MVVESNYRFKSRVKPIFLMFGETVTWLSEMNALYNGASVKAVTSSVQELQAIKVDQFCGKYAALDVYGPQNAMARKVLRTLRAN